MAYMFAVAGPYGISNWIVRLLRVAQARRGAGRHALGARTAGERDQRDVAAAGGDRLRGMADVHDVGRAAHVGGVDMAQLGRPM